MSTLLLPNAASSKRAVWAEPHLEVLVDKHSEDFFGHTGPRSTRSGTEDVHRAAAAGAAQHSQQGRQERRRLQSITPVGRGLTPLQSQHEAKWRDGMKDEKDFSFKTRAQRVGESCFTPNRNSWPWAGQYCLGSGTDSRHLGPELFWETGVKSCYLPAGPARLLLGKRSSYGGCFQSARRESRRDFL